MTALLIALLFAADPCPEPPSAKFEAKFGGGVTKFETKTEKDYAVWIITCPRGRGEAAVKLKSGSAKKVIIRFAGQRNLVGIKMAVAGRGISGRMGQTVRYDARGRLTDKAADAVLTLTIRAGKDCVEAVVESKDAPKQWAFGWINENRKD
jgi:hypothetical protein